MADEISSRELVRAIGAEFDRRGWSDPDDLALGITQAAVANDGLHAEAASGLATPSFLEANDITSSQLRAALRSVFGSRVLVEKDQSGPTYIDQSVSIGDNNTISGSINVGGNQLILNENSSPDDILNAVTVFVSAGIGRGFSSDELSLLDHLATSRSLDLVRLEDATRSGIEKAKPDPGRLAKFRDAVMSSTTSGLVVQAILAVAGSL